MSGMVLEFGYLNHSARIKAGLALARRQGVRVGRPTNVTPATKATVLELHKHGYGIGKIARLLRIGVGTTSAIIKAA